MNATRMLGIVVVAGLFGAVAGGIAGAVMVSSQSSAGNDDSALMTRLDELANGLEGLRNSANETRDAVAAIRERVVSVEMAAERRAGGATAVAGSGGRMGGMGARAADEPDSDILVRSKLPDRLALRNAELAARMGDMEAAAKAAEAVQQRFGKSMKIRAMPEAERWQYTADTLGLNSVQVDELRGAHDELQASMKEAITSSESTLDGGASMTIRQVDGSRLAAARKAFQDRVDNALNDEQKKSWKNEGFASAMGGGRSGRVRFTGFDRSRDRSSGDGDASTGAVGIHFVSTEVEIEDDPPKKD